MSKGISKTVVKELGRSAIQVSLLTLIAVVGLLGFTGAAKAFGEDVKVGGFVSQGYIKSTGNPFLLSKSEKGSPEFFEGAVNFMTNPTDKLRIGIQVTGRDYGEAGNSFMRVDWAYGDYRFRDYLGLRVGLTKIPLGLHNQYRDIDMARTPIFLPQSIYAESDRDYQLAVEGASVYGNVDLDLAGDFDYEAYWGVSTHTGMDGDFTHGVNDAMASMMVGFMVPPPFVAPDADYTYNYHNPTHRWDYQTGGSLRWNTPLDGLMVGMSYYKFAIDFNMAVEGVVVIPNSDPAQPAFTSLVNMDLAYMVDREITNYYGTYSMSRLKLSGEYSKRVDAFTVTGQESTPSPDRINWYVMADYRVTDKLAVAAYYDFLDASVDDDNDHFSQYQKDINISLRYDINNNWLVKADMHNISGIVAGIGAVAAEENWKIFAVKNTFYF